MTTTPLVALQKPKGISIEEIESELRNIWRSQNDGATAPVATRASTFSIVVYEPEEFQQLLAALTFYKDVIDGMHGPKTREAIRQAQMAYGLRVTGRVDEVTLARLREEYNNLSASQRSFDNADLRGFNLNEAIAAQNPCRVITLCPTLDGDDESVTAQVSAYCPVQKRNVSNLICCEYITLRGSKKALDQVAGVVSSLMIGDLPKFVWWKATPNPEQALFSQLADTSNCLIVDSSYFSDAESELNKIQEITQTDKYIADLNWHRLFPWQELTAEAFDPPERRDALAEIDHISIDHEPGNAAQAVMFLGWIASRLGWTPTRYVEEGGDYGIRKVYFQSSMGGQREIEAELAAIPVADVGEVIGDLVGIRLASDNQDADCCTILCSESTGCMRMEAGGGAQACRVEEVSAISDQRADLILSQQLQRWGEDVLYQESLAMADQILRLCP